MSIAVAARVKRESFVEGTARLILLLLADCADDSGVCWPGDARLAAEAGVQERQVQRHLRALEEAGEIVVLVKGRGRGRRTVYLLCPYAAAPLSASEWERRYGPANRPGQSEKGVIKDDTKGVVKGVIAEAEKASSGDEKGVIQGTAYKDRTVIGTVTEESVYASPAVSTAPAAPSERGARELLFAVLSTINPGALGLTPAEWGRHAEAYRGLAEAGYTAEQMREATRRAFGFFSRPVMVTPRSVAEHLSTLLAPPQPAAPAAPSPPGPAPAAAAAAPYVPMTRGQQAAAARVAETRALIDRRMAELGALAEGRVPATWNVLPS